MADTLQELEVRLRELDRDNPDSIEKGQLLIEIGEHMMSGDDPKRLAEVTAELRRLSQQLSDSKGEAHSLWCEGLNCCFIADHDEGLKTVDQSRSMFEAIGDDFGVVKATFMEANLFRSIGSFDKSLQGFLKALQYFREQGLHFWEANALFCMGLLYLEIGDYSKAFDNFTQCMEVVTDLNEPWIDARALNGIGTSLQNMGKLDEALDYHHRSLAIFQEMGHQMGEARALDDIGSIHLKLGDYDLALAFHEKALKIRQSIGQKRAQGTSLINIARVHVGKGDADAALTTLDHALSIAEETKSRQQIYDVHRLVSKAYELKGDHVQALKHYKDFERTKGEVFNDQTGDKIRKLQIGFEVEKAEKEAEIERLKNVELREKNDRLRQLLEELRETQSQLVQSEKMAVLGKLVGGMLHEMNTPLGASNSAIDVSDRCITKIEKLQSTPESIEESYKSGELHSLLQRIQENHSLTRGSNERISKLLATLKSFSGLDEGERKKIDIHDGLEQTLSLIEHQWRGNVEVVRDYRQLPLVDCCPGEMNQVFMNVLTNAADSIDGKGTITIRTTSRDGRIQIQIADTGVGIEPDRLESLFDPGFSAEGPRVKAGLGLLVSLNIIRNHGGNIEVNSRVGKGTTITIILPRQQMVA
jgi:signal transduction histidine kinase/Tfp pilus assembly protein PilF